jgi:hypothetical protein
MKAHTVLLMLRELLALLHAAILAHPDQRAVAATLRALAAEAQRTAHRLERSLP